MAPDLVERLLHVFHVRRREDTLGVHQTTNPPVRVRLVRDLEDVALVEAELVRRVGVAVKLGLVALPAHNGSGREPTTDTCHFQGPAPHLTGIVVHSYEVARLEEELVFFIPVAGAAVDDRRDAPRLGALHHVRRGELADANT